MAQKTIVSLIDDISGGPADETVSFGVDGQDYVIDLAADSAEKLRAVIGRYAGVARVVKLTPARPRPRTRTSAERQRSQEIRQWAMERGFLTSGRGRIPEHVAREYEASRRVAAAPVFKRAEPPADLTGRERAVMASIRDIGKPGKGGNVVAGKLRQRGLVERDDSTGVWSITKGGGA
jgi:Lsr2